MEKLLGILPYIYFEEPVQLGEVSFVGLPDWQGRNHGPQAESDRQSLQELSTCFSTTRRLSTSKGAVRAITYFLLDNQGRKEGESLEAARKAVTLLRYALLRADTQALDNIESTYLYAFALPPAGHADYHLYHCWPNFNQEIWISPKRERFPRPGWYIDFQLVHTSSLEDIQEIQERFYVQRMPNELEANILLAMEWYNQSFQKYSICNVAGHLVDISIAFETLFQLQKNKTTLKDAVKKTLNVSEGSPVEHWAGAFYGEVRSAIEHSGKPASLLFRHPEAQTSHLSFLWSARRIFRECVATKAGLPRHIPSDRLVEELIPNEIHLNNLKKAGSFQKVMEGNLLEEVQKLRANHPAGNREDIIWLGKELLRGYKERFMNTCEQSIPAMDLILCAEDSDPELGSKYYQFAKEFSSIYPYGYIAVAWGEVSERKPKNLKPIHQINIEQWQLESAIYHFAEFAGWALPFPP